MIAAASDWTTNRQKGVKALSHQLPYDPAAALVDLNQTSMGCDWLVSRWEWLGGRLETNGDWSPLEKTEAFVLLGCFPETGGKRWDPTRFLVDAGYVYDELEILKEVDLVQLCLDSMKPRPPLVSLKAAIGAAWLVDPAVTAERMKQEVTTQVARLKAASARLWVEVDEPSRARALEKAQVIHDEATAKRMLRYLAEAKSAFAAAEQALERTLEQDAERAAEGWMERLVEAEESESDLADEDESVDGCRRGWSRRRGTERGRGGGFVVGGSRKRTWKPGGGGIGRRVHGDRDLRRFCGGFGTGRATKRTWDPRSGRAGRTDRADGSEPAPEPPEPDHPGGVAKTSREWGFPTDVGGESRSAALSRTGTGGETVVVAVPGGGTAVPPEIDGGSGRTGTGTAAAADR